MHSIMGLRVAFRLIYDVTDRNVDINWIDCGGIMILTAESQRTVFWDSEITEPICSRKMALQERE